MVCFLWQPTVMPPAAAGRVRGSVLQLAPPLCAERTPLFPPCAASARSCGCARRSCPSRWVHAEGCKYFKLPATACACLCRGSTRKREQQRRQQRAAMQAALGLLPADHAARPARCAVLCRTVLQDSVTGFFSGSSEKDASSEKLDAFKGGRAPLRWGRAGLGMWAVGRAPGGAWAGHVLGMLPVAPACLAARTPCYTIQGRQPHTCTLRPAHPPRPCPAACLPPPIIMARLHGGGAQRVPQPRHHGVCHRDHPHRHGGRRVDPPRQGAAAGAGGWAAGGGGKRRRSEGIVAARQAGAGICSRLPGRLQCAAHPQPPLPTAQLRPPCCRGHTSSPQVPIRTLIVNQVLQPGLQEKYLQARGGAGGGEWGCGEWAWRELALSLRCGCCPAGRPDVGCCCRCAAAWPRLVLPRRLPPSPSQVSDRPLPCAMQTRRADQQRALERLRADPELGRLQLIEAPLFDLEVGSLA